MAARNNIVYMDKNQKQTVVRKETAAASAVTLKKGAPDIWIFLITFLLVGIGVVMVFSASYYDTISADPLLYFKRQGLFSIAGIIVMCSAMHFSVHKFRYISKYLLYGTAALLILVFAFDDGSGTHRWIPLGIINLQPSEVAKFTLSLYMADRLSRRNTDVNDLTGLLGHMLFVVGIGCFLVYKGPDLGNTVVLACMAMSILIVAGLRWSLIFGIGTAGCAGAYTLITSSVYQMRRIEGFLDPWADPLDTGYQTISSLLALGSGGFWGLGMGGSRQKLGFLPEQYTDFIFSIIGEELGFMVAGSIIVLFLLLVWRGYLVSIRCPDRFGSLLAAGLTTGLGLQAALNLGVATGSLPVTGIVLPFISYGGSSMLMSMGTIGVLLNISRYHSE